MKILVVSLLRLGDIVMTTPALEGLRKQYPSAQVDLLINKQFAGLAPMLEGVRKVHLFDRKSLQQSLGDVNTPIFEAYDQVSALVNRLNYESYDRVINLTHNRLSAWLIALLNSEDKRGLSFTNRGQASFGSPWFRYLNDYVATGGREVFHNSDIFYYGSGLDHEPGAIQLRETAEGVSEAEQILEGQREFILIQAKTSEAKKDWGSEALATALRQLRLLHPSIEFYIMGAPFEEDFVDECLSLCQAKGVKAQKAICSLAGALSLIHRARLLITGDTSVKHMACATKTPVVELSLGSSDYRKTGVYKEGSVIIQGKVACAPCSHSQPCDQKSHVCRIQIRPEVVALVANHLMRKQYKEIRVIAEEYSDQVEIMTTHIAQSGFWVAQPATSEMNEWMVNRWLEHSTWKMLLQKEHFKPVGAFGSEGSRIKSFVDDLHVHSSKESWFVILDKIEKQTRRSEGEMFWLKGVMRKALSSGNEQNSFDSWLDELRRFHERHDGENLHVGHLISREGWSDDNKLVDIRHLRKAQNYINDIYARTQIKLKLIRSLRSQVMESVL